MIYQNKKRYLCFDYCNLLSFFVKQYIFFNLGSMKKTPYQKVSAQKVITNSIKSPIDFVVLTDYNMVKLLNPTADRRISRSVL